MPCHTGMVLGWPKLNWKMISRVIGRTSTSVSAAQIVNKETVGMLLNEKGVIQ